MKVGTIDTETLSTQTKAVVWEVGVIIKEVEPWYKPTADNIVKEVTFRIQVLEQVIMGRHIDPESVAFQRRILGPDYQQIICATNSKHGRLLSVNDALDSIRELCWGLDELWINKSSFDYSVLNSLKEQVTGQEAPLWPHRSELDIRTLYRKVPGVQSPDRAKSKHRGLDDCRDNWLVLERFGEAMLIGEVSCDGIEGPTS